MSSSSFLNLTSISSTPISTSSLVQVAHRHRQGIDGVKQDKKEAARLYQLAAEEGDTEGEAWLAYFHLKRWGGLCNDEEAFRLSRRGVAKGNPLAFHNLGYCYHFGRGVNKDMKQAIKLFEKGVTLGNSSAQNNLGYCYQHGQGGRKDLNEAIRLYKLSSDQGNFFAQTNLAVCYQHGFGIEKKI